MRGIGWTDLYQNPAVNRLINLWINEQFVDKLPEWERQPVNNVIAKEH
jgi:hypothetical protein